MKQLLPTFAFLLLWIPKAAYGDGIWNLNFGDRFAVEHIVEQETSLSLEGGESHVSKTKERIVVHYRVNQSRQGQTILEVRMSQAELLADGESEPAAGTDDPDTVPSGTPMYISVGADGLVDPASNFSSYLQSLAGASNRARTLVESAVSEQALCSWMALPFWVTPPADEEAASWDRISELSLGMLGTLRSVLTFTSDDTGPSRTLTISANTRHRPLLESASKSAPVIAYSDVAATLSDFRGTARLRMEKKVESEDNQPPNARWRPWFEDMELAWKITGSASIRVGDQSRKLTFQQTQKQVSRLLPESVVHVPRFAVPEFAR